MSVVAVDSPGVAPAAEATAVTSPTFAYSGLVTRAIAMTIDALVVNAIALIVAAAWALVSAMLPGSQKLHALEVALAAVIYGVWVFAYFAAFWSTTGQTPGARVMHIRVVHEDGARLHIRRALTRFAGTIVAAIPLFAGFVPILFSSRRRALNDWVANSIVVQFEPEVSADARTHVGRAQPASQPPPPA